MDGAVYIKCGDGLYTALYKGVEYSIRRIKPNYWEAIDENGVVGSGKTRGDAIAVCQIVNWV
mgnify:CR=1 FL=1